MLRLEENSSRSWSRSSSQVLNKMFQVFRFALLACVVLVNHSCGPAAVAEARPYVPEDAAPAAVSQFLAGTHQLTGPNLANLIRILGSSGSGGGPIMMGNSPPQWRVVRGGERNFVGGADGAGQTGAAGGLAKNAGRKYMCQFDYRNCFTAKKRFAADGLLGDTSLEAVSQQD